MLRLLFPYDNTKEEGNNYYIFYKANKEYLALFNFHA